MLSIIVPAHDEESVITKTVAAAAAAGRALGSPYEVIVVDDASADRTGEIARDLGARVVRIEARQIAAARNAGARAARGDRFLFLDADTLPTPQSVRAAVAALDAGAVAGGAAVTLDEPVPSYARSLVRVLRFLYRRLHLASGCFLFCSREAFEAVGGFDETLFAAEEVHMSRALGRQGRVVMLREIVVTSGRKVRTHSAWEVLGTLARLTLTGERGLRDRSRLGLWYGPRRSDPGAGRDGDGPDDARPEVPWLRTARQRTIFPMSWRPSPEALFADFAARVEAGERVEFEGWVEEHRSAEEALRRLHADWQLQERPRPVTRSFFGRGERERPRPAPGLEPGKVVGDFRLLTLIGQGGMGQVWEAEQLSLNRRIAVKFVRPERITAKQLSYFQREARAGGRLSHPGIVAIHGFGEDDGIAWIAMELVEGCWTLRDFLDDAARADEVPVGYDRQVAQFVAKLARALQAAHDAGVIHRDLKPQNILITPDESPKVTDFGLARLTDETALSQTGDFAGTYYYMSPEQVAAGRMGIDHRTDIFSLGVVAYEMLTLRRPFQGDTTHQVVQQIMLRDPPNMRLVRSRIPRDLSVICGKALEKDPERRYPSMAELVADIERHLANEPIHAKPPMRLARVVKWTKRNPTKSAAALVAALAFAVISVLALRIARQKGDLELANEALAAKTEEAQANARAAEQNAEEARANALRAQASAAAEKRRADEVLRLSLAQDYQDLMTEAGALWPAYPERIPAYEAWIARAQALVGHIPDLETKRDQLRALALPVTAEQERADREERVGERWTGLFSDEVEERTRARWWHNQLTGLIAALGSLVDAETGLLSEKGISPASGWSVPRRLAFARRLEAGFAEGSELAARWAAALPKIRGAYPGLDLSPQMGLVPIGADRASGLWEFWHVQSGAEPVRGDDGKWLIAEETGIVLVLLPGGKFWMGAQSREANGRNHDPNADPGESPVHEVELSAFFLSKYELTQEQWERMAGVNPSYWKERTDYSWIKSVHPVEQVSWLDCTTLLPTLGLELPSEAQWEYACRAGAASPRPFAFEDFAKHANIADEAFVRAFTGVMASESWDDGLGGHGPVGSLLPNAFGLHDVIGNVWEWCVDGGDEGFYGSSPPNDPVNPFSGSRTRMSRGGSFVNTAILARSAVRYDYSASTTDNALGVRPARAIID